MSDPIRDYIDANRGTYTREALRAQLLAAGHDAAAVDAALAEAAATRPGQATPDERRTFGTWAFRLHLLALVAMVGLIVALKGTESLGVAMLGAAVLAVALLIGWGISSLIGRALLPHTGSTIALVVPLISAVALGGSCFALMNASISAPPRDGTVHLVIEPPRAFDESGTGLCYLRDYGVQVVSQEVGLLDGREVSLSLSWYEAEMAVPVDLSIEVLGASAGAPGNLFTPVSSTTVQADVAPDFRSGTVDFDGLAGEPSESSSTPETISGSVSWDCE